MTVYATTTDFERLGLATGAASRVPANTLTTQLSAKSAFADGYIRRKFKLPLSSWGDDLRECVCVLAAEASLGTIGWNPEDPANAALVERAKAWRRWLEQLGDGDVEPEFVDATSDVNEGGAVVYTRAKRGW